MSKTRRFGNWLFLSSGKGKETPTLLGPLERANRNSQSLDPLSKLYAMKVYGGVEVYGRIC
jgi:hypothetical protein